MSMLVFVGFGPFRSLFVCREFSGLPAIARGAGVCRALFVWRATIRYHRGNLGREVRNSLRLEISQMQVPRPQAKKSRLPVAIPRPFGLKHWSAARADSWQSQLLEASSAPMCFGLSACSMGESTVVNTWCLSYTSFDQSDQRIYFILFQSLTGGVCLLHWANMSPTAPSLRT